MKPDFYPASGHPNASPAKPDQYAAADIPPDFDAWTQVGVVELDRYCQRCGYNLITQPVRREPRLDVLIVRCPECGRFESTTDVHARRLWLSRLLKVALVVWIAVALLSFGAACGLLAAPVFAIINDSLTWTQQAETPPRWVRAVRTPDLETVALAIVASLFVAFAFVAAATVLVYHWRRWAFFLLALLLPTIAAAFASSIWYKELPKLWPLFWECIWLHWRIQIAAGLLGAVAGRATARLLARLLIPASLRSAVSFLWLADQLPPPRTPPAAESPSGPSAS